MLEPLAPNRSRRAVVRQKTVLAPVGGWDAANPLAAMPEDRAVQLDNMMPRPSYLEIRGGSQVWASAIGSSDVETLMSWNGPASSKMIAAGGGGLYDATLQSDATELVTGLTSNRWQHTNFRTSAGSFLYIVNGSDDPRYYNGSSWTTPSISGITASNAININVHKKRVWFVLKDSTKAAYLATEAVAGTATEFDVGSQMPRGGYLMAMGTWSRDGGAGPDDYAVFVSSQGDVVLYQGTDPSSSTTWSLVGTFFLAPPIGRRCLIRMGGDLLVVTIDGIFALSKTLDVDRSQINRVAVTENITNAMAEAARLYRSNDGWQMAVYPRGTMLVLNVPVSGTQFHQYVMNTLTGAWARFTGWDARCIHVHNERLYFGGDDGLCYLADEGSMDVTSAIRATVQGAYSAFDTPQIKRFTMLQPLIVAANIAAPQIGISLDFAETSTLSTPTTVAAGGAKFDSAVFDVDVFGASESIINDWSSPVGIGRFASIKFIAETRETDVAQGSLWGFGTFDDALWGDTGESDQTFRINGFSVLYEPGGAI